VRVLGPDLVLRYPRPDDVPALYELGSDPEVVRFFSWGPYRGEDEARAYVDSVTRQRETGRRLEFLIVGRADDAPIGVTGLSEFARRDRRAVVGTWLGRDHWGSGANTESKALILGLGFRRLGLERATALASPGNARSLAALERLGFVQEGVLRAWHRHGDRPEDCAILRFMREDFERSPLARVSVEIEGEPPAAFVTA
jgi:ribosomal-protein-alanine N-acetyltransferase